MGTVLNTIYELYDKRVKIESIADRSKHNIWTIYRKGENWHHPNTGARSIHTRGTTYRKGETWVHQDSGDGSKHTITSIYEKGGNWMYPTKRKNILNTLKELYINGVKTDSIQPMESVQNAI